MPWSVIEERDETTKTHGPLGRDQTTAAVHGASALAIGHNADARHTPAAAACDAGRTRGYVHRPLVVPGAGGGTESALRSGVLHLAYPAATAAACRCAGARPSADRRRLAVACAYGPPGSLLAAARGARHAQAYGARPCGRGPERCGRCGAPSRLLPGH